MFARYFVTGAPRASLAAIWVTVCSPWATMSTAFDNFSTGRAPFLTQARGRPFFKLIHGDLLDSTFSKRRCKATIWCSTWPPMPTSVSAPSIREGSRSEHHRHLQRARGHAGERRAAHRVLFDRFGLRGADIIPTPETAPFPVQTSLYGASKLAAEGLIAGLLRRIRISGLTFFASFPSWASATRTDTCSISTSNCCEHPGRLRVLGNGRQRKSYLYVQDCVDAILMAIERADGKVNVSISAPTNTAR